MTPRTVTGEFLVAAVGLSGGEQEQLVGELDEHVGDVVGSTNPVAENVDILGGSTRHITAETPRGIESRRESRWGDLNPRPNPYEGFALASLSYTGPLDTGLTNGIIVANRCRRITTGRSIHARSRTSRRTFSSWGAYERTDCRASTVTS